MTGGTLCDSRNRGESKHLDGAVGHALCNGQGAAHHLHEMAREPGPQYWSWDHLSYGWRGCDFTLDIGVVHRHSKQEPTSLQQMCLNKHRKRTTSLHASKQGHAIICSSDRSGYCIRNLVCFVGACQSRELQQAGHSNVLQEESAHLPSAQDEATLVPICDADEGKVVVRATMRQQS